jgi:hypothetical protein
VRLRCWGGLGRTLWLALLMRSPLALAIGLSARRLLLLGLPLLLL